MKKTITLLLTIIFSVSFSYSQSNLKQELKYMMKKKGYRYIKTVSADLRKDRTKTYYRYFTKKRTYAIIAYSDSRYVKDMDIRLYDLDGTRLAGDKTTSRTAVLVYRPLTTRKMKIRMKNDNCTSSTRRYPCHFMIFYK